MHGRRRTVEGGGGGGGGGGLRHMGLALTTASPVRAQTVHNIHTFYMHTMPARSMYSMHLPIVCIVYSTHTTLARWHI